MSRSDHVQINVNLPEEPNDYGHDDAWEEGYAAGIEDGWAEATLSVFESIKKNCEDPCAVLEKIFPVLPDCLPEGDQLEELLSTYDAFKKEPEAQNEPQDAEHIALGKKGEDAAVRHLRRYGYEILERNWECPYGEADIIARDEDGTVVFIEVKTRSGIKAGIPEEAITPEKRSRYERIALSYMSENCWDDEPMIRFDAIGICANEGGRAMLRHHRGCFDA